MLPSHPLRDHARLRHAAAAWRRPPAGRHAGASAEPAALRRQPAARDRGLRHPPAARQRQRRQRDPDDVRPASSPGTSGVDPYTTAVVRRLSGPVSRGQLRRQGHLRRRRLRGSARRAACRRTRCSATTSSRASTRAPARAPTSSWSTTIPAATWRSRARQHRWVRGDWQIVRWLWRTVPDASGGPSCAIPCR